jgi:hypothetical protein
MSGVKVLVYCHGSGVDNLITPQGSNHPEASLVHAAYYEDWTVISPYGHGDLWGNAQQSTDFSAALALLLTRHPTVDRYVFAGTSMGGQTILSALLQGLAPAGKVKGVYAVDGAVNLKAFHSAVSPNLDLAFGVVDGTLSAAASAGATSISSSVSYPAGTKLQIEYYLNGAALQPLYETVTVAPAGSSGSGPYAIPLTTALANAHASGTHVSDFPNKMAAGPGGSWDPSDHAAGDFPNIRYRFGVSSADTTVYRAYAGDAMATKLAGKLECGQYVHLAGHASTESFWPRDFVLFLRRCAAD